MTDYLSHTTLENQRWDSIADIYYGDVTKMGLLIEENPHAPISPTLPAGMVLRIPVIEPSESMDTSGLPPWKK